MPACLISLAAQSGVTLWAAALEAARTTNTGTRKEDTRMSLVAWSAGSSGGAAEDKHAVGRQAWLSVASRVVRVWLSRSTRSWTLKELALSGA
ncbi:hypothetical protein [Deinococcus ruber]|uniref:hypothetical protein n=1 Tax=Deinococcus ruber TaxID=1848197 RepID=UPI001669E8CF|nr:hypothetical protein [Deinococcus ruber]